MARIKEFSLAIGSLILVFSGTSVAQPINPKPYAEPVFSAKRAVPDFSGDGARYRMFRTAITQGFRENPIAFGHYTIITVGCGTQCNFSWVGDLQTGKIIPFPIGGEDYPSLTITARPDSRLVIARWTSYDLPECHSRIYAFENNKFIQIRPDILKREKCL